MRIQYRPTIDPIVVIVSAFSFWSTFEEHLVAAAAQNAACL